MEQLGIEPQLLLAQIINFAIIFFILSKLLYKPILTMLEKRKKEIAEGLALTDKMRQEDEKHAGKRMKLVEEARKEARAILEEAKGRAKDEAKEIIAEAHHQSDEVIAKAKVEGERLKREMEKGVRDSAVEIGVAMSKRLLTGVLSEGDQHKLLMKQLKELEDQRV